MKPAQKVAWSGGFPWLAPGRPESSGNVEFQTPRVPHPIPPRLRLRLRRPHSHTNPGRELIKAPSPASNSGDPSRLLTAPAAISSSSSRFRRSRCLCSRSARARVAHRRCRLAEPAVGMERGRSGRDADLFGAGSPFAGFGRLGPPMPSLFGGRDPFDDPFFTQPPFGGGPGLFGPMGGPGLFGRMGGAPGMSGAFGAGGDGFLEQAPARSANNGGGPVITEIDGDEEGEDGERGSRQANHGGHVQEPDDGDDGMQGGQVQLQRDPNWASGAGGQSQSRTFTYQSSKVTYGGINGAYYTASKARRSGSDGITVEESKEADTTTKEATHRISRGIHDKGHSVTRKLKSDGKVDSTQILHNLNEDELSGFEESWQGNAGQHLPGWNQNAGISNGDNSGNRSANGAARPAQSWALPGTQQFRDPRRRDSGQPKSSRIIPIS